MASGALICGVGGALLLRFLHNHPIEAAGGIERDRVGVLGRGGGNAFGIEIDHTIAFWVMDPIAKYCCALCAGARVPQEVHLAVEQIVAKYQSDI